MKTSDAPKILIANELLSGLTVYFDSQNRWTTDVRRAVLAENAEDAARIEAAGKADEAANRVVGVYLVPVQVNAHGDVVPLHFRERMRVRAYPSFWINEGQAKLRGSFRVSI